MNETRPPASDRRRGGAHLRRGRGWSRSMVAGGLLGGLLLFAMAVLAQPRASAWVDAPELKQESVPGDSDEDSAAKIDGKTGFERHAAEVAADAAAALEEMAESEPPVAAAGPGSQAPGGGSGEQPGGRGRGPAGVTPPDQVVKPDEVQVPAGAEGEQLPGGDEPDPEGETGTLPDWLRPVAPPEIALVPTPPPPAAAPASAPAAAEPQLEAEPEEAYKLEVRAAMLALTVPIAIDSVPIHLRTYNQNRGSNLTLVSPFTVVGPSDGFYSFEAPPSWDGLPFEFWGAGAATLGENPEQAEWIWVGDGAIWAAADPDAIFFSNGEQVEQVTAYYRLDVP